MSTIPLSIQLERLDQIGISINPDIDTNEIFNVFKKKEFEDDPCCLIVALGCGVQTSEDFSKPISNSLWYLNTECIEDAGDYVRIVERIVYLAQGNLPLSNIHDYVDIDNKNAWLSFNINDKEYKWDLEVNNDWLDINIFSMFNRILSNQNGKRFAIAELDQSILIGFFQNKQVTKINELFKFKFAIV